jgi:hypothetical protein
MKRKKAADAGEKPKKKALYTAKLEDAQLEKLERLCEGKLWERFEVDYARYECGRL